MNADVRSIQASFTARRIDWSERLAKGLLALALIGGVAWALAQGGLFSPVDLAHLLR
ncbi:MAG: hypothetical protein HOQ02_06260 [Lysobacter sp.]|nr:hypothetical protein [Lysobacter sp.]